MSKSSKQKLNTKSSTETEVVGCSDYTPAALWAKNFLDHQGYTIEIDLHQDNQSAMRMARNGRKSCGQKSRHIDIRYFWLQDRIQKGEINLTYCPTEIMVADFFTKPLQGSLFRKMKAVIMGEVDIKTFMSDMPARSKERVGKHEKDSTFDQSRQTDEQTTASGDAQQNIDVDANESADRNRLSAEQIESSTEQNRSAVCEGSGKTSYAEIVKGKKNWSSRE